MTDDRSVPFDPRADGELWDLVAALPVPAAADDFMPRLRDRIAEQPGPAAHPGARARARGSSQRRLFFGIAAAAVAAVICALVVLPALHGPPTATAADILASMNAAAGGAQTVRLRIVEGIAPGRPASPEPTAAAQQTSGLGKTTTEDVTLSTTGDFYATQAWWSQAGQSKYWIRSTFGYDERRHALRLYEINNGDGVETHRPAWSTDFPNLDVFYLRYQAAASSVRAQLAEADPGMLVSETTYLGRPAWRATLADPWSKHSLTVTVDKATGLLMETQRAYRLRDGTPQTDFLRVTSLEIDPALPNGWNIVPLLKRTTPQLKWNYFQNRGTRFGTPQAVATRSWPTLPLLPQWAPAGYRLTDVANAVFEDVRRAHENDNSWRWSSAIVKPHGRVPGIAIEKRLALGRCKQGVLIRFRRGFGTFVVEISPRLPGEPGMGKLTKDDRLTEQDVTLTGGFLKGAPARTWISSADFPFSHVNGNSMFTSEDGPTLLTYSDRSMITIYGDLTRQELTAVANSLQVYGDVAKPLPAGYGD